MSGDRNKENLLYLVTGIILLSSEIWKQYVLAFVMRIGPEQWSYLPFQLCSLPMYLCILVWAFRDRPLRQHLLIFLSDFSLLSGLIAFLDTSGMHYGYVPLTVHSYLWHLAIAGVGIYSGLLTRDRTVRSFLPAAGIYLVCCGIAELINFSFDSRGIVNMFYINPHYYMNQIVFSSMLKFLPNRAVILIYIFMTMLGAFLIHLFWLLAGSRVRKGRC